MVILNLSLFATTCKYCNTKCSENIVQQINYAIYTHLQEKTFVIYIFGMFFFWDKIHFSSPNTNMYLYLLPYIYYHIYIFLTICYQSMLELLHSNEAIIEIDCFCEFSIQYLIFICCFIVQFTVIVILLNFPLAVFLALNCLQRTLLCKHKYIELQ